MQVANLPALADKSPAPDRYVDLLIRQMADGVHPRDIARKRYPKREDRGKRLNLYRRLRLIALGDERVAAGIAQDVQLELMVGLGPTVRNLLRQTRRRPDAAKLVLEASGFHNPRVKHDHSGQIEVRLVMPRPQREEIVPDAEVVDDP